MEEVGIYLLNPGNDSTCGLNCYLHISIMNRGEHNFGLGSDG